MKLWFGVVNFIVMIVINTAELHSTSVTLNLGQQGQYHVCSLVNTYVISESKNVETEVIASKQSM
jgi:hypothetical protein